MFTYLCQLFGFFLVMYLPFANTADLPEKIFLQDINNQLIRFPTRKFETQEHAECFKKATVFANTDFPADDPIQIPVSGLDFNKYIDFCKRYSEGFRDTAIKDAFGDYDYGLAVLTMLGFPIDELPFQQVYKEEIKKRKAESKPEELAPVKYSRQYQQRTIFLHNKNVMLTAYDDISRYLRSIPDSVIQHLSEDFDNPKDLVITLPFALSEQTRKFLVNMLALAYVQKTLDESTWLNFIGAIISILPRYEKDVDSQIKILREVFTVADYLNLNQLEKILNDTLIYIQATEFLRKFKEKMAVNPQHYLFKNIEKLISYTPEDVTELVSILEAAHEIEKNNPQSSKKILDETRIVIKQYQAILNIQRAINTASPKLDEIVQLSVAELTPELTLNMLITTILQQLSIAQEANADFFQKKLFKQLLNSENPLVIAATIVIQCHTNPNKKINFPLAEYLFQKYVQSSPIINIFQLLEMIVARLNSTGCNSEDINLLTNSLVVPYDLGTGAAGYIKIKQLQKMSQSQFTTPIKITNIFIQNLVNDANRIKNNEVALAILMGNKE